MERRFFPRLPEASLLSAYKKVSLVGASLQCPFFLVQSKMVGLFGLYAQHGVIYTVKVRNRGWRAPTVDKGKGVNTIQGKFFDTVNTITALCPPEVLQQSLELCGFYNDLLSRTVYGSDVWRINHAKGRPAPVSRHTAVILRLALEMYRASGRCFNIAVAPAVELWNFTDGSSMVPDPDRLAEAIARTDCDHISLKGQTVTVPPQVQIDLGGIAKGYIADRIA